MVQTFLSESVETIREYVSTIYRAHRNGPGMLEYVGVPKPEPAFDILFQELRNDGHF